MFNLFGGPKSNDEAPKQAVSPETDWYDRRYAKANIVSKERRAVAEENLIVAQKLDADQEVWAKSYVPEIVVTKEPVGWFLKYGETDVNTRYVESIAITNIGSPPGIQTLYGMGAMPSSYCISGGQGTITITMISGMTHPIQVSRHKVDILHEALNRAWRETEYDNG